MGRAVKYEISQTAYVKLALHALKHQSTAVNGVLVGSVSDEDLAGNEGDSGAVVTIVDAVPLSHGQLGLLPMLELALNQVDDYFTSQKRGLGIVGYYHANERFDDYELSGIAKKVGDQIARYCPPACILLLDNRSMQTLNKGAGKPAVQLYVRDASRGWRTGNSDVFLKEPTANSILYDYILEGREQNIVDFDEHLDDITKDWLNPKLFD